jgi:hypothetical protein
MGCGLLLLLPAACCLLPAACCLLPAACCLLSAAACWLRAARWACWAWACCRRRPQGSYPLYQPLCAMCYVPLPDVVFVVWRLTSDLSLSCFSFFLFKFERVGAALPKTTFDMGVFMADVSP